MAYLGTPESDTADIVVAGPLRPADVPRLCEHIQRLPPPDLGEEPVVCDVAELAPADLCAVDALARMTLTARRLGRGLTLRDAPSELRDLLALAGLADVMPCAGESGAEPRQ
jgi:ABC-type transporter Mla MlaB component